MNDKVNAIVLTTKPHRENDLLLTVLTENNDKLTIILFNANKTNSKRKSTSLPLTKVQYILDYNITNKFYSPKNIDILKQNYNLYINNNLILTLNLIIEIINKSNIDSSIYNILSNLIDNINEDNYLICLVIFIKYMLQFEGIIPQVEHCTKCNSTKIINFSNKSGGFVCVNHNDTIKRIEQNRLLKIRAIIHADYNNINYFKEELSIDLEDIKIFIEFYEYHLNTKIKTNDFFLMNI